MTPLQEKLVRQIAQSGPISVADYMGQCLFDPHHGYYNAREPFGGGGDFVTAPEISQMFGEMLAVWWLAGEAGLGLRNMALAEIGPGRGTLMDDMLRTIGKLAGGSLPQAEMVEISPRLSAAQRAKLRGHAAKITWHSAVEFLPDQPLGIIANELFDAIPVRQFVKTRTGWFERMIRAGADGGLAFALGPSRLNVSLLPAGHEGEPEGQIFEHAPARRAMAEKIAAHLKRCGGFALFIDYGHAQSGFGDTLQAVRGHAFSDALAFPGEADLTTHVDFPELAKGARGLGVHVSGVMEQGAFLRQLGIVERAEILKANTSAASSSVINTALTRLIAEKEMGSIFKVLALCSQKCDLLPLKFQD
jgi:SAM-dependent MidA family methyltransferase